MSIRTIKHIYVCGPSCSEIGAHFWTQNWGLGFSLEFHLPGLVLRLLLFRWHVIFRFGGADR